MILNPPIWVTSAGEIVSCTEKIKVMQQNIEELQQIAQDVFEDGVLMGIDPKQLRQYLEQLMHNLQTDYP